MHFSMPEYRRFGLFYMISYYAMLARFFLLVDFNAVSWEGVKFRGRAFQCRNIGNIVY